jgi:bacterioferritin
MSKDAKKVIDLLHEARARELTAILQYMVQHYDLANQDYGKLAKVIKQFAIVEMKHAEALGERIVFLGGTPTSKPDAEIKKNQTIPEMIATDVALEDQAIKMYNAAAAACAEAGDRVTKDIFEKILGDEDGHFDEFTNIQDHIEKLGNVYLATLTGTGG